jgi:phage gp37-like protein
VYTITQIEDAMITRLESQMSYLRTCEPLAEYLKTEISDKTLLFPAAYVCYVGGTYHNRTGGTQDREMIFAVVVMARSFRNEEAARHGQGTEKGVYDLLEDARDALSGQTLGLSIAELQPIDEDAIEGTETEAVYQIRFRTWCEES